ncbi:response regulator [Amycolatopsis stemonae]
MIRTLVVDDDYRIARVHAAGIGRVEGFTAVGEAHSVAEARRLVAARRPELLLLDLYLPDGHGLDLMRSLRDAPSCPDFVVITAAQDVDSVRRAMQLGAVYYLVKPFGFAQLRDQLTAYNQLQQSMEQLAVADQAAVDSLYSLLRAPSARTADRHKLPPTMAQVLDLLVAAEDDLSAVDVAERLEVSRATAQRYLADLVRRGLADLRLHRGGTGRPEHRYRAIG